LWKDRKYAPQAAEALKITAGKLFELGIADAIVPEPLGGAHRDPEQAAENLKAEITRQLDELSKLTPAELKAQRYDKFRAFGAFDSVETVAQSVVVPEEK
jgi:acetyl-CoA carboxylase carboxyl transferase subunit alpha